MPNRKTFQYKTCQTFQFIFRLNYSTNSALMSIVENIQTHLNNGEFAAGEFAAIYMCVYILLITLTLITTTVYIIIFLIATSLRKTPKLIK